MEGGTQGVVVWCVLRGLGRVAGWRGGEEFMCGVVVRVERGLWLVARELLLPTPRDIQPYMCQSQTVIYICCLLVAIHTLVVDWEDYIMLWCLFQTQLHNEITLSAVASSSCCRLHGSR